jgi:hypothetical protein
MVTTGASPEWKRARAEMCAESLPAGLKRLFALRL